MLLETLREYGLEQLEASGEAGPWAAPRQHYLLAEGAERKCTVRADWGGLERENDNLRAALQWS